MFWNVGKGSHFIFVFIKTKETISIQSVIGGVRQGRAVGECDILPTLKEVWRIDVTDYFCSGIGFLEICASVLD